MCGIFGVLALKDSYTPDRVGAQHALSAIAYRGPDGTNVYEDAGGRFLFGHQRLSIIDLSETGRQPMILRSRTGDDLIVSLNGEIYNYRELARELRSRGHQFFSSSDTEVIGRVYDEWGVAGFSRLRGMFAISLYDVGRRVMLVARDRFGIKPLYFFRDQDKFVFGSQLSAVTSYPGVPARVRPGAIGEFLFQGYILQPNTFFQDIFHLDPGYALVFEDQKSSLVRFADITPSFSSTPVAVSLPDAISATRDAMADTVSHHLVADVPVGAFLSGGLDSTALVAFMRHAGQKDIATISAVFPGTSYDESGKARAVASFFKTKHTEVPISEDDFISSMDSIIDHLDQPSVDGVNTYFVSRVARQAGLKVVLSGVGGDEVFFGYPTFTRVPALSRFFSLANNHIGEGVIRLADRLFPFDPRVAKLASLAFGKKSNPLAASYLGYRSLFSPPQIQRLWAPGAGLPALDNFPTSFFEAFPRFFVKPTARGVSVLEFSFYLRNQLLRDADVMSMAHSIELRTPFVDHVFTEAMLAIPDSYKIYQGVQKYLLVECLRQAKLPPEIVEQKKRGFVLPIDSWLRGRAGGAIFAELASSPFYNRPVVYEMSRRFTSRRLHWSRIWALFILHRFLKRFPL